MAHIQISHRDVTPQVASFHLPDWTPRAENPDRSRQEAMALAQSLALRARAAPSEFGRLAREYSDDVATRELGGELGGMSALGLTQWPEILDAVEALGANEVSRVVETEFGFHVLLRRSPPEERNVSGARLIIGYDEAPWLHRHLARWPIPPRSRAAALELARELSARLQKSPELFAALVEKHSDHRDALRGGDFGQWSTREVTPWFRELVVLEGLDIGQVSLPLDSPFGVEILMRTADRPRQTYAMAELRLDFNPDARSDSPDSMEAAQRELARVAERIGSDAALFARERARRCCELVRTWSEGRGNVFEEAALARLAVGEISRSPTRVETFRMSLLQRLEPTPPQPAAAMLDLPRPRVPNLEWLLTSYGDAKTLAAVKERAVAALHLEPALAAHIAETSPPAARFLAATDFDARLRGFREFLEHVSSSLGAERHARYLRVFEQYVEERLMRPRAPGPSHDPETGLRFTAWPLL